MIKKILLMLFLISSFSATAKAQSGYSVIQFKTTAYAQKIQPYGWSDWQASSLLITFYMNRDVITINSPRQQIYQILDGPEKIADNGGSSERYYCEDADGDRCYIRLRVENKGTSQLYVDFKDLSFVYNVIRIRAY